MSLKKQKALLTGGMIAAILAFSSLGGSLSQAAIQDEYQSWKQYGSEWSTLHLGASGETVARSGCAVTSAAILMVKSGSVTDEDFTPGTLVNYMNQNGGFSSGGGINWDKLSGYAPSFVYQGRSQLVGTQSQKAERIKALLDEGYYVIAVVKNGGHFVAVDSVNGDQITMNDPGSRSTSLFEKYPASGLVSIRIFTGGNSQIVELTPPPAPDVIETTAVSETTVIETTTTFTLETEAPEETTEFVEITEFAETAETTTAETVEETSTLPETTTEETTTSTETTTTEETTTTTTEATTTTETTTTTAVTTTTEAPRTIYISTQTEAIPSQAQAGLFEVNDKHLYMHVKVYTTEDIYLRAKPNSDSEIFSIVPKGTYVDVVEIDNDFKWGRIAYDGNEGWISLEYAGL